MSNHNDSLLDPSSCPNYNNQNNNSNNNNSNGNNNGKGYNHDTLERKSSSTARHRSIPRQSTISSLRPIDSSFIEVVRCLHQIKAIVQSLLNFQAEVIPTLSLSTYQDPTTKTGSIEFFNHIQQYLNNTFHKLERLCKIIMMVLSRLEQHSETKQERIASFRKDIIEEWRVAVEIRQRLQSFLNQNTNLFDGSMDNSNNINNNNNNNNFSNNNINPTTNNNNNTSDDENNSDHSTHHDNTA
ncbi:hypothetical protein BJ944DRAFT_272520 [Cunninghamella echinulata]|nr:hypothetical protein BJ944DRAFT_272520 [Cunninghamella echinulata]